MNVCSKRTGQTILVIIVSVALVVTGFSQTEFADYIILDTETNQKSLHTVDLDFDGDTDFVLGEIYSISWWENDGNASFTPHQITEGWSIWGIHALDFDNDGDVDIVAARMNGVFWWENEGNQEFTEHEIADLDDEHYHAIYCDDIDSDGDKDVAIASQMDNYIAWLENDGEGPFIFHYVVGDYSGASDVKLADIDEDGDMDIAGLSYQDYHVNWWENDGDENFTNHLLPPDFHLAQHIYTLDFDGDGDIDIMGDAYDDPVSWWENDGNANFTVHDITIYPACTWHAYPSDLDNDGDIDVLQAKGASDGLHWWENNGEQEFTWHTLIDDHVFIHIQAADLDSDTDADILAITNGQIYMWENLHVPFVPIPFDLSAPQNDSLLADLAVTLHWTPARLPVAEDSITYQVQVSRYEDFHAIRYENAGLDTFFLMENLLSDVNYWWRIRALNHESGESRYSNQTWLFTTPYVNTVDPRFSDGHMIDNYQLTTYPNPFNATLNISVGLPVASSLGVKIFNISGQEVCNISGGQYERGIFDFTFNTTNLTSGIYFVHASVPGKLDEIRKVVLMK